MRQLDEDPRPVPGLDLGPGRPAVGQPLEDLQTAARRARGCGGPAGRRRARRRRRRARMPGRRATGGVVAARRPIGPWSSFRARVPPPVAGTKGSSVDGDPAARDDAGPVSSVPGYTPCRPGRGARPPVPGEPDRRIARGGCARRGGHRWRRHRAVERLACRRPRAGRRRCRPRRRSGRLVGGGGHAGSGHRGPLRRGAARAAARRSGRPVAALRRGARGGRRGRRSVTGRAAPWSWRWTPPTGQPSTRCWRSSRHSASTSERLSPSECRHRCPPWHPACGAVPRCPATTRWTTGACSTH